MSPTGSVGSANRLGDNSGVANSGVANSGVANSGVANSGVVDKPGVDKAGAILIVPACERGRGSIHLSRCLLLFRDLLERESDVYLWIPDYFKDDLMLRFKEFFGTHESLKFFSREEELAGMVWAFIVLDRCITSREEYVFWAAFAPLIGIDEEGPCRDRFDFLIDLLPSLSKHEANISAPGLLSMPKNRRPPASGNSPAGKPDKLDSVPLAVLISFGAEDSGGLGPAAARALSTQTSSPQASPQASPPQVSPQVTASNAARSLKVTLVAPDVPGEELPGVTVVGKVPNLREHFAEYDLLITRFGIGAFEAVYAGLPVLLVSPDARHEELANNAGFYSLGVGTRRLANLALDKAFMETLEAARQKIAGRFGLEEDQEEDLASIVDSLALNVPRFCPVCEEKTGEPPVLARFPAESYRCCPVCGAIYQSRLNASPVEYEKEYFLAQYKKQYGKTYLEDFDKLKQAGKLRLKNIRALLGPHDKKKEKPLLLDIGCAYGPFLAAAAESGFSPMGVDPVKDAVRYVKGNLRFPVWNGFFPDALPAEFRARPNYEGVFDAVTLWHVIEHFGEAGKTLREIHGMLKKGGVLALSTISSSGISGRTKMRSFLESCPPDQWTVWSPESCEKIFSRYGFRLKKIVITGHHPERFPFFGRFLRPANKGLLYRFLFLVSRLFRLGDTFEAYGMKL